MSVAAMDPDKVIEFTPSTSAPVPMSRFSIRQHAKFVHSGSLSLPSSCSPTTYIKFLSIVMSLGLLPEPVGKLVIITPSSSKAVTRLLLF